MTFEERESLERMHKVIEQVIPTAIRADAPILMITAEFDHQGEPFQSAFACSFNIEEQEELLLSVLEGMRTTLLDNMDLPDELKIGNVDDTE